MRVARSAHFYRFQPKETGGHWVMGGVRRSLSRDLFPLHILRESTPPPPRPRAPGTLLSLLRMRDATRDQVVLKTRTSGGGTGRVKSRAVLTRRDDRLSGPSRHRP